jgi:hypothetical protein
MGDSLLQTSAPHPVPSFRSCLAGREHPLIQAVVRLNRSRRSSGQGAHAADGY